MVIVFLGLLLVLGARCLWNLLTGEFHPVSTVLEIALIVVGAHAAWRLIDRISEKRA